MENINVPQLFQVIAVILTGLIAGLFYGYDCSVIGGLGKMHDNAYLQAFQSINEAIQNPYFFLSFIGSLIILPVTTWLCYHNLSNAAFYLALAATLLYVVGVFGVTVFFNVPLNEKLAQFTLSNANENEMNAMRTLFENSWNSYHKIRTMCSIACFVLTIVSLLKSKL